MKIETFFTNLTKLASAPSSTAPTVEVDKKDMKEIISYLEKQNIPHSLQSEQELSFKIGSIDFLVIENEKDAELDIYGKPVNAQKWEAQLSPEDQKIADANTFPLPESAINQVAVENEKAWDRHEEAQAKASKEAKDESKEEKKGAKKDK